MQDAGWKTPPPVIQQSARNPWPQCPVLPSVTASRHRRPEDRQESPADAGSPASSVPRFRGSALRSSEVAPPSHAPVRNRNCGPRHHARAAHALVSRPAGNPTAGQRSPHPRKARRRRRATIRDNCGSTFRKSHDLRAFPPRRSAISATSRDAPTWVDARGPAVAQRERASAVSGADAAACAATIGKPGSNAAYLHALPKEGRHRRPKSPEYVRAAPTPPPARTVRRRKHRAPEIHRSPDDRPIHPASVASRRESGPAALGNNPRPVDPGQ